MTTPPIVHRIDFDARTGALMLVSDNVQYPFTLPGQTAGETIPASSISGLRAAMDTKLDAISTAILKLLALAGTPIVIPGGADMAGWLTTLTPIEGGTLSLPAGAETGSTHIGVSQTINGKGMRVTTLDGQQGVGSGHKLAWGKGIVHIGAPTKMSDIGLLRGGGGDKVSDGEAGVYCEWTGSHGTVTLTRLAFDGCEDGIFMPDIALANIDLLVDGCVFGRLAANGLSDERSHDMYVAGAAVAVRNSVFVGNALGNTVKCRGPYLELTNNYIGRFNGRWIDIPGGTKVVSIGNTYVSTPGTPSQNAIGLYDEGDTNANPGKNGSFISTNDTFYFSRGHEVIWINSAAFNVQFNQASVYWIGPAGSTPPVVEIQGPGVVTGNNPFVFTEANRVDAPPPVPADPVA